MEQRRGRESVTVDFFVDICKNSVTNSLVDTGWTFGTDLVIGTGLIIFVELIIVDGEYR